jgi:anti-sigma28 factor (negative regulator of flagellin synthesis)
MRVYDQTLNGTAAARAGGAQDVQRQDRTASPRINGTGGDDRVELSTTMSALSRALNTNQSDRADRVAELAAQYSRGEYRPDSFATARAMLTEALSPAG